MVNGVIYTNQGAKQRAVSKSNEASELDLQTCSDRKKGETGKYIEIGRRKRENSSW